MMVDGVVVREDGVTYKITINVNDKTIEGHLYNANKNIANLIKEVFRAAGYDKIYCNVEGTILYRHFKVIDINEIKEMVNTENSVAIANSIVKLIKLISKKCKEIDKEIDNDKCTFVVEI